MDVRQLATFVAVAEELHFGRAAERMGISQPAASQAIRRFENELSVVLFERSSHHVALSSAGAELLPLARKALAAAGELSDAAVAIVAGSAGRLRIATTSGIGPSLNLLSGLFHQAHPGVTIDLQSRDPGAKREGLRSGDLDLAFVRSPVSQPGLRVQPLWSESMVAVVPAGHPAAAGDVVDANALEALPLIVVARRSNPAMHDQLVGLCHHAGIEPRLGPPLRGVQEAQALIAAGLGWSMVPEPNAPRSGAALAVVPFPEPAPHTQVSLVWRAAGLSASASAFVDVATAAAADGRLPAFVDAGT